MGLCVARSWPRLGLASLLPRTFFVIRTCFVFVLHGKPVLLHGYLIEVYGVLHPFRWLAVMYDPWPTHSKWFRGGEWIAGALCPRAR